MRQAACWRSETSPSTGTSYLSPTNGGTWTTTAANGTQPWCVAGTFRNLAIRLISAPGSGKSLAFTLMVNGAASSVVVTISDLATTGSDVTHTATVADGDTISLRCVGTSTPTVSAVLGALDFDSTTTGQSGYGGTCTQTIGAGVRSNGLLSPMNVGNWAGEQSVAGVAGNFTALRVLLSAAPGVGTGHTFGIVKNGVLQDGSGGTPDTRLTITDAATAGSSTFTLTCAAGDLFFLQRSAVTGSPAATSPNFSVRFVATADGEAHFCSSGTGTKALAGTEYATIAGGVGAGTWNGTEANRYCAAGISAFTLDQFRLRANNTVGGTGIAFTTRVGGVNSALTATITGTSATDLTNSATVAALATVSMEAAPLAPSSTRFYQWGMRQIVTVPATAGWIGVIPTPVLGSAGVQGY